MIIISTLATSGVVERITYQSSYNMRRKRFRGHWVIIQITN